MKNPAPFCRHLPLAGSAGGKVSFRGRRRLCTTTASRVAPERCPLPLAGEGSGWGVRPFWSSLPDALTPAHSDSLQDCVQGGVHHLHSNCTQTALSISPHPRPLSPKGRGET